MKFARGDTISTISYIDVKKFKGFVIYGERYIVSDSKYIYGVGDKFMLEKIRETISNQSAQSISELVTIKFEVFEDYLKSCRMLLIEKNRNGAY